MAVSAAYKYKVRAALMQFVKTGLFPYYSECGFGAYGPWKNVLDEISREENTKRTARYHFRPEK
jgi:hypothetical protein